MNGVCLEYANACRNNRLFKFKAINVVGQCNCSDQLILSCTDQIIKNRTATHKSNLEYIA